MSMQPLRNVVGTRTQPIVTHESRPPYSVWSAYLGGRSHHRHASREPRRYVQVQHLKGDPLLWRT